MLPGAEAVRIKSFGGHEGNISVATHIHLFFEESWGNSVDGVRFDVNLHGEFLDERSGDMRVKE